MMWILIAFACILLFDLAPMIRKSSWQGVGVLLLVYIPAFILLILWQLKIPVPSVLLLLGGALKSVGLSY